MNIQTGEYIQENMCNGNMVIIFIQHLFIILFSKSIIILKKKTKKHWSSTNELTIYTLSNTIKYLLPEVDLKWNSCKPSDNLIKVNSSRETSLI